MSEEGAVSVSGGCMCAKLVLELLSIFFFFFRVISIFSTDSLLVCMFLLGCSVSRDNRCPPSLLSVPFPFHFPLLLHFLRLEHGPSLCTQAQGQGPGRHRSSFLLICPMCRNH